jgi:hypothetical protein
MRRFIEYDLKTALFAQIFDTEKKTHTNVSNILLLCRNQNSTILVSTHTKLLTKKLTTRLRRPKT